MLLLAGFILAGAAIIAIGTYNAIQTTEQLVVTQYRSGMVDLFLNSRHRAVEFFGTVSEGDVNASVNAELDDYLSSQYLNARALGLDLNATLAAPGTLSPETEADFVDADGTYADTLCPFNHGPVTGEPPCYGDVAYDALVAGGADDGLITRDGLVLGAIVWLQVTGTAGKLEEMIVIDVPATEP